MQNELWDWNTRKTKAYLPIAWLASGFGLSAFSFVLSLSTLLPRLHAFAVDFCLRDAPPLPGLSTFEVRG
jgi:hypothetical protein